MASTFDYVVVGAGAAGCVIAEGLSARHNVLLLEAGGSDRRLETAIPAAFSKNFNTDRDWAYRSEREPTAFNRRLYLPQGKMLGGSSSINAMIYARGRPSDFDGWEAAGAKGWGWADVLPVFKEMESNSRGASEFHGGDGPLRVEDLRNPSPYSRRFVQAAIQSGIKPNDDFNGDTQEGVGYYQVTQRRGRRWSAADAFLRPAMQRPTLTVVINALCLRLLFDGHRAHGVEFSVGGVVERVHVDAEVILSAGTFGSPQVLQRSGIGDPETLRDAGVSVLWGNHHVGGHMQDHPIIGVIQQSRQPDTLDDAENLVELVQWALLRRGRLTSNVAEAGAFVRSSVSVAEPDLQFHFGPVNYEDHGRAPYDGHAYSLGPMLLKPRSEGSVAIPSSDPVAAPRIVGNYLQWEEDVAALVNGVRLTRKVLASEAFDDVRGEELIPGPAVMGETDLEQFVRERVELLYHPVGTCRMGLPDEAVVDPDLRVYGFEGLRVIDASVMPRIVSANTLAATMMIAAVGVRKLLASG